MPLEPGAFFIHTKNNKLLRFYPDLTKIIRAYAADSYKNFAACQFIAHEPIFSKDEYRQFYLQEVVRPNYDSKIQELSLKILPEQEKAKQIKEHYQKSKEQLLKAIEAEFHEKKIQNEEDLSNFIEPVHEMIYPPVFFQGSLQAEQDLDRLSSLSLQQYAETEYFPKLISENLQKRNFSQALLFVEKQPPRLGLREALDEASSIFQESIDVNNEDLIREFMQFLSKSIECGQGELLKDKNATQYFFPMLTAYLEQAVLEKKFSFLNGFCDGIKTSLFLQLAFKEFLFESHPKVDKALQNKMKALCRNMSCNIGKSKCLNAIYQRVKKFSHCTRNVQITALAASLLFTYIYRTSS